MKAVDVIVCVAAGVCAGLLFAMWVDSLPAPETSTAATEPDPVKE